MRLKRVLDGNQLALFNEIPVNGAELNSCALLKEALALASWALGACFVARLRAELAAAIGDALAGCRALVGTLKGLSGLRSYG